MAINKIWVVAEAFEGKPLSVTLELLTKARELAGTVEAIAWGGDVETYAADLGKYGASKVLSVGDLDNALPGAPVSGAMAEAVNGGETPDAILFAQTYDQRDIAARLSAKLGRGVLTNVVDLSVEGDNLVSHHSIFGGTQIAKAAYDESASTGAKPHLFLVRPKSFAAEEGGGGAPEVTALSVPDLGATSSARVVQRHVEERTGPKLDEAAIVVSGGRGLGEKEKYAMIE